MSHQRRHLRPNPNSNGHNNIITSRQSSTENTSPLSFPSPSFPSIGGGGGDSSAYQNHNQPQTGVRNKQSTSAAAARAERPSAAERGPIMTPFSSSSRRHRGQGRSSGAGVRGNDANNDIATNHHGRDGFNAGYLAHDHHMMQVGLSPGLVPPNAYSRGRRQARAADLLSSSDHAGLLDDPECHDRRITRNSALGDEVLAGVEGRYLSSSLRDLADLEGPDDSNFGNIDRRPRSYQANQDFENFRGLSVSDHGLDYKEGLFGTGESGHRHRHDFNDGPIRNSSNPQSGYKPMKTPESEREELVGAVPDLLRSIRLANESDDSNLNQNQIHQGQGQVRDSPSVLPSTDNINDNDRVVSNNANVATLDTRSYTNLEGVILEVKLFLEHARHLALRKADASGRSSPDTTGSNCPLLFATIIIGSENNGAILKSILEKIFRNRNIISFETADGESLQVLAMSGVRDESDNEDEAHHRNNLAAHGPETPDARQVARQRPHANESSVPLSDRPDVPPNHGIFSHSLLTRGDTSGNDGIPSSPPRNNVYTPSSPSRNNVYTTSDPPRNNVYYNSSLGTVPVDGPHNQRPQQQHSSMISPILDPRLTHDNRDRYNHPNQNQQIHSALPGPMSVLAPSQEATAVQDALNYVAMLARSPTISSDITASTHQRDRSALPIPMLDETGFNPPIGRAQPLPVGSNITTRNNTIPRRPPQQQEVPRNTAHNISQDPPTTCRSNNDEGEDINRAIMESQAAHIAHTRRQVSNDIQFRKAMQRASDESAMMLPSEAVSSISREAQEEEEELLRMATGRSVLDERARRQEAEQKYEAEIQFALRQSQLKREEERHALESEEEVLRRALVRSQTEEEEHADNEEEVLRRVMRESMLDNANVDEDTLAEAAMKMSLSDSEHGRLEGGDIGQCLSADDMLEQVLKLSLEEKTRAAEEEEEQMRLALEWSMMDSTHYEQGILDRGVSAGSVPSIG